MGTQTNRSAARANGSSPAATLVPAIVGAIALASLVVVGLCVTNRAPLQTPRQTRGTRDNLRTSLAADRNTPDGDHATAAAETAVSGAAEWVRLFDMRGDSHLVQRCDARCLVGVDCNECGTCGEALWAQRKPIPWEVLAQGEYVGPFRDVHVPEYRLRVDDELEFIYRLTRIESPQPYELNVGDTLRVESLIDENLDRELVIQPDGMITLRMLGQVRAARRTITELRDELEERYKKYYKVPAITVTPLQMNTRLEDLRAAVASRYGVTGGQAQQSRVTPEGTIQLPAIGSIPAQGLTLDELKKEIDERYAQIVEGMGITPRLLQRAPRYVFVAGEVRESGRFTLEGPTTAMQAISLAGGWNNGANLRQIVVFRRTENWKLIATKLDLRGALLGERPCPADEVFLRDSDIVVVPKSQLLRTTDLIELLFTRGLYGVFPMQASINFSKLSSI